MLAVLQPNEILLIVVVIMVLFGSTQIPKLARSLGQAQKEFKSGLAEGMEEADESVEKKA